MKIAKFLAVISFLFVGINHSVTAQDILSAEQQEQIVENVTKFIYDLNLSERDKPAFRTIVEDFFIGLVALRATNFSPNTNKKVIRALAKDRDRRVKNLLTSDQYKVYKARTKERQANIREFMKQQR